MTKPRRPGTAGLLLIGDEILSGRTKDKNLGYVADFLTALGIDLMASERPQGLDADTWPDASSSTLRRRSLSG